MRVSFLSLNSSFFISFFNWSSLLLCSYNPQFPASSPYVVAVGGTQGPENGDSEEACSSRTGGIITTGGGFSNHFARPLYQEKAVSKYLDLVDGASNPPLNGYNKKGRGYPDVSLLAYNYVIYVGGDQTTVSGTSASTPVFAGMVALVNSDRLANGQPLVGWLNPALYAEYTNVTFIHDITSGENSCGTYRGASTICCDEGFSATEGW
jgi:tripeptidyl-peptidase-1